MADQAQAGPAATEELPGAEEALEWIGFKVDEIGGSTAGRVEGVLVDAEDGSPTWLAIRVGRFGRRTAVPYELAAAGVGHVWVPYSRDAIRSAPEIDPAAGVERERERELGRHYGLPDSSKRMSGLAERDQEGPTSVPAAAD